MALKTFACPCGTSFQALTGGVIADDVRCPDCGSQNASPVFEVPRSLSWKGLRNWDLATPGEIADQLATKRDAENNADKIHSGEWKVRNPKGLPSALKPNV